MTCATNYFCFPFLGNFTKKYHILFLSCNLLNCRQSCSFFPSGGKKYIYLKKKTNKTTRPHSPQHQYSLQYELFTLLCKSESLRWLLYAFRLHPIRVCSCHIMIAGIVQMAFQEMSYNSWQAKSCRTIRYERWLVMKTLCKQVWQTWWLMWAVNRKKFTF